MEESVTIIVSGWVDEGGSNGKDRGQNGWVVTGGGGDGGVCIYKED